MTRSGDRHAALATRLRAGASLLEWLAFGAPMTTWDQPARALTNSSLRAGASPFRPRSNRYSCARRQHPRVNSREADRSSVTLDRAMVVVDVQDFEQLIAEGT